MLIILGAALGCICGAVTYFYLLLTRSLRRKRNVLVLLAGYVLIGFAGIGGTFGIRAIVNRISRQEYGFDPRLVAMAFALAYATVTAIALRTEFRWRKLSAGQ